MIAKAFAATDLSQLYMPASKLGKNANLGTLVAPILTDVLIVSGLFAFFTIIFAGFSYISSSGDKAKVAQAQNMLNYGILGLVLVVGAYLITNLIGRVIGFQLVK